MMAEMAPFTLSNLEGEIKCYQAMSPHDKFEFDDPLLVHKSVSDPGTSKFHEAMKEKDKANFQESTTKEIENQFAN
jgi:hypothetical protein